MDQRVLVGSSSTVSNGGVDRMVLAVLIAIMTMAMVVGMKSKDGRRIVVAMLARSMDLLPFLCV